MRYFITNLKIVLVGLGILTLPLLAESHRAGERSNRPVAEEPSRYDLQMYLEVLDAKEKHLQAVNDYLLNEANYGLVKIPMFIGKAAMDGYFFGRILGVGKSIAGSAAQGATTAAVAGAHKGISQKAIAWLNAGGLEKLRTLGFNLGVIGVSATNNTFLLPGYRWQYGIPIYGTAYAAYLWSDQLMNSADMIEKNGNEILKIRKEKYKVRAALEKSL